MLKVHSQKLTVDIDEAEASSFASQINEKFQPIITTTKKDYLEKLNLTDKITDTASLDIRQPDSDTIIKGDIFLADGNTIFYYNIQIPDGTLEAGYLTKGYPKNFNNFISKIEERLKDLNIENQSGWEIVNPSSEALEAIGQVAEKISPSQEEIKAACELENETSYNLMQKAIQDENLYLNQLQKDWADINDIIANLLKNNLISKDYIILCKKTGQQILRVSSKEAIEETSQKGFKCYICGNNIAEENIDELITCSEFGRKMVTGDWWLLIMAYNSLLKLGIQQKDIFIQRAEEGSYYIFINFNNRILFLVLNNKKLSLDDTFSINAQISAYRLPYVAIISTQKISYLLKRHLKQSNPNAYLCFTDSLANLDITLEQFLEEAETKLLKEIIEPLNPLTSININKLIIRKFTSQTEKETTNIAPKKKKRSKGKSKNIEANQTE